MQPQAFCLLSQYFTGIIKQEIWYAKYLIIRRVKREYSFLFPHKNGYLSTSRKWKTRAWIDRHWTGSRQSVRLVGGVDSSSQLKDESLQIFLCFGILIYKHLYSFPPLFR